MKEVPSLQQALWKIYDAGSAIDLNQKDLSEDKGLKKLVVWQVGDLQQVHEDLLVGGTRSSSETNTSEKHVKPLTPKDQTPDADSALALPDEFDGLENVVEMHLKHHFEGSTTAYRNGEKIQYFSESHRRWISGVVHVTMPMHGGREIYSVVTSGPSQQQRRDVPLCNLRPPLQEGEPLEFWCKEEKTWLPAQLLQMRRPGLATVVGYNILLPKTEEKIHRVDNAMLRPRYEVGQKVEIYRGVGGGWSKARVIDHTGMPPAPELQEEQPQAKSEKRQANSSSREASPESKNDEKESQVTPPHWTYVAVREEGAVPEWVPSYLVRSRGVDYDRLAQCALSFLKMK